MNYNMKFSMINRLRVRFYSGGFQSVAQGPNADLINQ